MTVDSAIRAFAAAAAAQDKLLKILLNGNAADLSALSTTTKTNLIAAINEVKAQVNGIAPGAVIDDSTTSTTKTWSSTKTNATISAAVAGLVASAPAALDTLTELAAALGGDANFASTTAAALGSRVRFDAAQTLTAPQKTQALANIGAAAAADIGPTDTDYVALFNAALV